MLALFVVSNVLIALAYAVLGFYVAPRFTMIGAPLGILVAKYSMLGFFVFCATTHVELALHVSSEPRANVEWMLSWHMIINHVLQALAAPVAAVLSYRFLNISLVDPRTPKGTS